MNDKLPALPTRPTRRVHDVDSSPWDISYSSVEESESYMDAQDARIKHLESDAESTAKRLGYVHLESIRQANKIAELEREIREADDLLGRVVSMAENVWNLETPTIDACKVFTERNAEKEQAS